MRDTRYGRFEHVRPENFKHVDETERRWERQLRPSFLRNMFFPFGMPSLLVFGVFIANSERP
jgi:hypothetical protein